MLSKTYHPDTNMKMTKNKSDPNSHKDFIELMEAYQVLSKTHSRANYDLSLKGIRTVNYVQKDVMYEPWNINPMNYREKGPNFSPYYGIKGLNKMSNWKIGTDKYFYK